MNQPLFQLGISSMGCPQASLEQMLDMARRFDLAYVELRSLCGTIDLPALLRDTPAPAQTGPQVRLLATSLCLFSETPEQVEDFFAFAQLAHRWAVPFLRVFGAGGFRLGSPPSQASLAQAAAFVNRLRAGLRERGYAVEILLETHDVFSAPERCVALNALLDEPLRILWDSFHTWNLGQESPAESWAQIGAWVAHVHHHDSANRPGEAEPQIVCSGQGIYPCAELKQLLLDKGYSGGVTLEWEKLWHPHLEPLEEVTADFVTLFDGRTQA